MKLVEMHNFQRLTSHHQLCVVDDVQGENEGSDSSVSNEGPFPGEIKSFHTSFWNIVALKFKFISTVHHKMS